MNTKMILTRAAVTGALVAVPLVAVVGTASADPLRSDRDDHSAPQQQQPDQFRLPDLFPQAPAPALQNPAPNVVPFDFFQGFSLPTTGSAF